MAVNEKQFERFKSEQKIYCERNLFLNDFKGEQKMAVNGNFSKSYTSDEKQFKKYEHFLKLNNFQI